MLVYARARLSVLDPAASKDDLLDMITHGADKIINSSEE